MGKEMSITHGLVLRGAESYLSSTENIVQAASNIRENPEGFKQRVNQFTEVCADLVDHIIFPENLSPENHSNILQLRTLLNGHPLLSINSIIKDRSILEHAQGTYIEINQKIQTDDWEFPKKIKDEGMLTSGLLIEGYGLFLERLYETPGLARSFVLAFEEVLWNNYQGTPMFNDALPWMIEDREYFSPNIRQELDKLA